MITSLLSFFHRSILHHLRTQLPKFLSFKKNQIQEVLCVFLDLRSSTGVWSIQGTTLFKQTDSPSSRRYQPPIVPYLRMGIHGPSPCCGRILSGFSMLTQVL